MKERKLVIKFKDQSFWCTAENFTAWVYEEHKKVCVRLSNGGTLNINCEDNSTAYHTMNLIKDVFYKTDLTEIYLDLYRHTVLVSAPKKDSAPKM